MARSTRNEEAPGEGPKRPKRGKGSAVLIRVTQGTRTALEDEAERTGRSLSQTAEIWLDAASKGNAEYHALLGGTQLAAAIEKLVQIARTVAAAERAVAAADRIEPDMRHTALLAAWRQALPAVMPQETVGALELEYKAQKSRAWDAYEAMLSVIDEAPDSDPVRSLFYSRPDPQGGGVGAVGRVLMARDGWVRVGDLRKLQGVGGSAEAEIKAAIEEQEKVVALGEKWSSLRLDAERVGRAIAAAYLAGPSTAYPDAAAE